MKKRRNGFVTDDQFVRVWQRSSTAIQAAKRLRLSPQVARSRAMRYRKRGIKLKRMTRGGRPLGASLDVKKLNRIVRSMRRK